MAEIVAVSALKRLPKAEQLFVRQHTVDALF